MMQEVYQDYEPNYVKDENNYLDGWIFHYNSFAKNWCAVPRETYAEYWNDYDHPNVLRSSSIDTLVEILHRIKGDKSNLEKITSVKSR